MLEEKTESKIWIKQTQFFISAKKKATTLCWRSGLAKFYFFWFCMQAKDAIKQSKICE